MYGAAVVERLGLTYSTYTNQIILNCHLHRVGDATNEELEKMIRDANNERLGIDLASEDLNETDPNHLKFIKGYAAMYELQSRHGDEHVLPLLGLRKPETLLEKLNAGLFGRFPNQH